MADPRARIVITAEDRASRVLRRIGDQSRSISRELLSLSAALGAGFSIKGLVDTARETEVLKSGLKTATGSVEAAQVAFAELEKFAARTPFALEQSIEAFTKLKNLGLDPSIAALESYGNTAAATGKDLNQFIEAVADAATGEFERLKEFGIKAKSQGDEVALTFRGVTTTVQKEAIAIEEYLRRIGDVEFAGALEERANTLDGALSNLGDSFGALARAVGDAGLTDIVENIARALGDLAQTAASELPRQLEIMGRALKQGQIDFVDFAAEIVTAASKTVEFFSLRLPGTAEPTDGVTQAIRRRAAELREYAGELRATARIQQAYLNVERGSRQEAPSANPFTRLGATGGGVNTQAVRAAQKAANDLLKEGRRLYESLRTPQEAYAAQLERANVLLDRGAINQQTYTRALALYAEQLDDATGKTQQYADLQKVIAEVDPVAPLLDQLDALTELEQAFPDYAEIIGEAMLDVQTEIDAVNGVLDEQVEKAEEVKESWQGLGPIMSSAFEDAIIAGGKFSDIVKGLEQDLLRLFTRNLVTKPLESFFSPGGGGGNFLSSLFGGVFGGARAMGGPVAANTAYLVGEQGPELFVPRSAGEVIPNGAGTAIVNNFSFVLPSDGIDHRRSGQQVAREAARYMQLAQGSV